MTDIIIVAVLLGIIGAAAAYVIKAKKKGVKCIGCPSGTACAHKDNSGNAGTGCGCGCGCSGDEAVK